MAISVVSYAAPVFSEIASAAMQRLEVAPAKTTSAYDTASLLPFRWRRDRIVGSMPRPGAPPMTLC